MCVCAPLGWYLLYQQGPWVACWLGRTVMEISIGQRFSPLLHVRERTMECTYIVRVCLYVCVCVQCATIGADLFVYSSISHPTCCCRPSLISNSIFNKICSKGNRWKLQGGSGGFGQLLSVAKTLAKHSLPIFPCITTATKRQMQLPVHSDGLPTSGRSQLGIHTVQG